MTSRTQWGVILAGMLVLANAAPSEAGLRHLFGSHGSSGGSSGHISWGSNGGSLGGWLHGGSHGSWGSGGSSGGSSGRHVAWSSRGSGGGSGGSSGGMMWHSPMPEAVTMSDDGYMPVAGMPMFAGQGMPAPMMEMTNATMNGAVAGNQLLTSGSNVPGTLGMTYQQASKRIAPDKHPRIGEVEITVNDGHFQTLAEGEEIKITISDEAGHFDELEGYFGVDEKWHFETKPLLMTIPNIYDATFEVVRMEKQKVRRGDKIVEWEAEKKVRDLGVRRFRMIPGRVVILNFP